MNFAKFTLGLIWTFIALALLALIGVTVLLAVYDQRIESMIASEVKERTGREIEISDGFGFRFNPRPTLIAKGIRLQNASWGKAPWMLEIDQLNTSFSLLALLAGKFTVTAISASKPDILVEARHRPELPDVEGGRMEHNWQFSQNRQPRAFEQLAKRLHISDALIEAGTLNIYHGDRHFLFELEEVRGHTSLLTKKIELHGAGRVFDSAFELDISVDNFRSMLMREPVKTTFAGYAGQLRLEGQGTVRDFLRWQGLDLRLQADAPSLEALSPWMQRPMVDTPPVRATAQFVQAERWASASLQDIAVGSVGEGVEVLAKGDILRLKGLDGLALEGVWSTDTQVHFSSRGFRPEQGAQASGQFMLSGSQYAGIALNVTGTLEGEGISATIEGAINNVLQETTPADEGLIVSLQSASLQRVGALFGKDWLESPELTASAVLRKRDRQLGLYDIRVSRAHTSKTPFLTGQFSRLGAAREGQFLLDIDATPRLINTLNTLNPERWRLPPVEKAKLTAEIVVEGEQVRAQSVDLSVNDQGNSARLTGASDNLLQWAFSEWPLSVDIQNIKAINAWYGTRLPGFIHLRGEARLSGNREDGFALSRIQAHGSGTEIAPSEAADAQFAQAVKITGSLGRLGKALAADLLLEAKQVPLSSFAHLIPFELPASLRLRGQAHLRSSAVNLWQVESAGLSAYDGARAAGQGELNVQGKITGIPGSTQYDLVLEGESIQPEWIDALRTKKDGEPHSSSLQAGMPQPFESLDFLVDINSAHPDPPKALVRAISLRNGSAEISGSGQVGRLTPFSGLTLDLALSSASVSDVPFLLISDLRSDIPATGKARIHMPENQRLSINITEFKAGDSVFQADVGWTGADITQGKPRIDATVHADRFDLKQLTRKPSKRTRLFSEQPFDADWIKAIDGRFTVTLDTFVDHAYRMRDVAFQANVESRRLVVSDFSAGFGEGTLSAWVAMDATNPKYQIISALKGSGLKPTDFNLPDSDFIHNGSFDIDVGAAGRGNSLSEIMGSTYGKIKLTLNNASIQNQPLDLFGSDLIFGIINTINPLRKKDKARLEVECGVIHFPVLDGVAQASQGIAIKTDKMTILGGGTIDLGSEDLNLVIRPKPRTGLGLSPSSIAQIVSLGGNIAKPEIQLAKAGLLEAGANIGAAVLTGGWSLLAKGLLDRSQANTDVCQQTIENPDFVRFSDLINPSPKAQDTEPSVPVGQTGSP